VVKARTFSHIRPWLYQVAASCVSSAEPSGLVFTVKMRNRTGCSMTKSEIVTLDEMVQMVRESIVCPDDATDADVVLILFTAWQEMHDARV
jgi:hypothetical protein